MPSLIETQRNALVRMRAEEIPRGATIPLELIKKSLYSSLGFIIDAGCGVGKSVSLGKEGYAVVGLDLNQAAISEAKSKGMEAFESDVTMIGIPGDPYRSLILVERASGVLAEGLLCNLVETQPERFFQVTDFYLTPEGYLFIADILQPSEDIDFLRERLSEEKADALVENWKRRYRANEESGLPYGTFVVAKLGLDKGQEWGEVGQLQILMDSANFERYARHYTRAEIRTLASEVDLKEKYFTPTIFYSRTGEPLLGFLAAYQKTERYRYHPLYKGMTFREKAFAGELSNEERRMMEGGPECLRIWARKLGENLAVWEDIFPSLKDLIR